MTGYGRAEGRIRRSVLVVELRSVNHRYTDVLIKVPRRLAFLEDTLKKKVRSSFSRGHIEVTVSLEGAEEKERGLRLDREAAHRYYRVVDELRRELSLPGEIDLALMVGFWDRIIELQGEERAESVLVRGVERVLGQAMRRLEKMRKTEGAAIQEDLLARLATVDGGVDRIEAREGAVVEGYRKRLAERIAERSGGVPLDALRLTQEVAILADRSDVSEERVRLRTHLSQLRKLLGSKVPVGRTIDFLLQEINREVNTIGSKANDAGIALDVVGLKGELEKIREQIQNIE